MKFVFLVFISLLFTIAGFSQSEKEVDAQLRSDLEKKQLYYDSIYALHSAQAAAYPMTYSKYKSSMGGVKDKRREAQVLAEEIALNYRKVMALEIQLPKDLVLDNVKRYNLPNYYISDEDLVALSAQFEVKDPISVLDLSSVKRKEQNEQIATKIGIYESASHRMSGELEVLRKFQVTINNLDTLNLWYNNLLKQYSEKNDVLKAELKKAEENFRTNGPDGFSQAYRNVFSTPSSSEPAQRRVDYEPEMVAPPSPPPPPEIYDVYDEIPEFPGGRTAMLEYFNKNMFIPEVAVEKGISGKVYLKFVVSESGNVSNVKVVKGIPDCKECDDEAVRVVKSMPDWIPAKVNGKVVNCWFNLPVTIDSK